MTCMERVPGPGRRLLDREEGGNQRVVQCSQGVSSHLPKSCKNVEERLHFILPTQKREDEPWVQMTSVAPS